MIVAVARCLSTKSRMHGIRAMGGGPVVVLAPVLEQAIHYLALSF